VFMILANHQRVVVGVDGSAHSTRAAQWAATAAVHLNSPLHIVSAVQDPTFYMAESAVVIPADVWQQQRRTAEGTVAALAAAIGESYPDLAVSTGVDTAPAADMLVALSHTSRLIVVGSSGSGLLTSILLGSTARVVADESHCPVVVWRDSDTGDRSEQPVAVGVDGSATSEVAVEFAFDFASHLGVPLVAVHAWDAVSRTGGVTLPGLIDWPAMELEERAVLAESLAGWSDKYPDVVVEHVVRQGGAARVLTDLSATCQLVVVGSHGRRGVARLVLGSTSSNLTHHGRCPVLICRTGE
jgi:nucleotide-binding universal stress UspA family protein